MNNSEFLIKKMNEFKEMIEYGGTEDVKMIFGWKPKDLYNTKTK